MTSNIAGSIQDLIENPEVKKLTDNITPELMERRSYQPPVCSVFSLPYTFLKDNADYRFDIDKEAARQLPRIIGNKVQSVSGLDSPDENFMGNYHEKRNIGVVFSGGPAPGGHNVIAGIFDAAKKSNPDTKLYGFLEGPDGIIENEAIELDVSRVDAYRNLGGFTMLKTGRTKINSAEKMAKVKETCKALDMDAIVIIGGDDSNTNAAFLAQELFEEKIQVIGVPKTIDGDIQVKDSNGKILCAMSFGFHTAARAYSNDISNLCTDGSSDVKYWHICKVMGRVASHLALEVGLQTHANITLVGEDLADYVDQSRIEKARAENTVDYNAYGMTLRHLSRLICDGIVRRAAVGKNYGTIIIPEGILESINEIQMFIIKLNAIISDYNKTHDTDFHSDFPVLEDKLEYLRRLARQFRESGVIAIWNERDNDLFNDIPEFFQEGLLTERDSHGNFQFSKVETDRVIMGLVMDYLDILKEQGGYRIGIQRRYYRKTLAKEGLDPDFYGPALFENYLQGEYLILKESIISLKTLKHTLESEGCVHDEEVPKAVEKIYNLSIPVFKTQRHFYGYDGRGNDPTRFDCIYSYNLGLTVFSLIANGATGQMAAIKNLEHDFGKWEPIGIPIGPLMHLEERKGKLMLVLEKSLVDLDSPAFRIFEAFREKWLAADAAADNYRRPGPVRFAGKSEEDRPITLVLNALGLS
ncbi:MAG: 6-phosphofructokinase [Desulfobacterales bacterium]|nr:6-phosphofructokinase [Desulfobacterales bacterium]